ncbi:ABC transporter permease [Prauserella flavalba]|uniref:ABC transporter permease n=1 Tax=Prauserella flavalba TaxID=1477506 RepID=UPI0036E8D401
MRVIALQGLVVGGFFTLWQFGPKLEALRQAFPFLDEFFISSPTMVASRLVEMVTGAREPNIWPLALNSAQGILLGGVIGVACGMVGGLVLSHWPTAHAIALPYLVALNATPKLALVPIFVVVFGPTVTTAVTVTAFVVFLVTLFAAVAGGRNVPAEQLLNAELLGGRGIELMRIRMRYVSVWTLANLPNIVATAFVAGLLSEVLSTGPGLGRLIRLALERLDATGTMALVVLLSIIGLALVRTGRVVARRYLHWFSREGLL